MKRKTPIYFSVATVLLLFVFIGCTHQQLSPSNTNTTNQSNASLNQQVNVNTNTNINSEIEPSNQNVNSIPSSNTAQEEAKTTYSNEEVGFSLEYPKDWTMRKEVDCELFISPELKKDNESVISENSNLTATDSGKSFDLNVCIIDNAQRVDLQNWVEEDSQKYANEVIIENEIINGEEVMIVETDDLARFKTYYFAIDDSIIFLGSYQNFTNTEVEKEIDDIISSFTVTNQYNTFSNDEVHFTFEYPEEWGVNEVLQGDTVEWVAFRIDEIDPQNDIHIQVHKNRTIDWYKDRDTEGDPDNVEYMTFEEYDVGLFISENEIYESIIQIGQHLVGVPGDIRKSKQLQHIIQTFGFIE